MTDKLRTYNTDAIDVTWSQQRCIHAKECVTRLAEVFDPQKRPWIQPENATVDALAETIHHCPTGALHYTRKDGETEPKPDKNTITLVADGPLYVRGDLEITLPDGTTMQETRLALCRCGFSENKPFCDNTHLESKFSAPGTREPSDQLTDVEAGGKLTITPSQNGPVGIKGNIEILDAEHKTVFTGTETWLCRCGASSNKPFCDGTHKRIDFHAE